MVELCKATHCGLSNVQRSVVVHDELMRKNQNMIILAGVPASGKSTTMLQWSQAGYAHFDGLTRCYYRHGDRVFICPGSLPSASPPTGPSVIHWSLPPNCCLDLARELAAIEAIAHRVKEVLLLVCPYRQLLARFRKAVSGKQKDERAAARRLKHLRAAANPEQISHNCEAFREVCQKLGLAIRIMDTSTPGKLIPTEKMFHEVLLDGMTLDDARDKAAQLIASLRK